MKYQSLALLGARKHICVKMQYSEENEFQKLQTGPGSYFLTCIFHKSQPSGLILNRLLMIELIIIVHSSNSIFD